MNPTITMRPIRSREGAALRDIRLRAIRNAPDAFAVSLAETLRETADGWTAWATQAARGETRILYVAEDAGHWIALAGGTIDPSGPADSADLISLWVDPAYRGQGLGRRLVAHVLGWAHERGRQHVALWVTETNTAAIALYARCGFREVGESQRLPSDPTLVERRMVRRL